MYQRVAEYPGVRRVIRQQYYTSAATLLAALPLVAESAAGWPRPEETNCDQERRKKKEINN